MLRGKARKESFFNQVLLVKVLQRRPNRRWCEDVEGDLREMRVAGWRSKNGGESLSVLQGP